jgi:hypothetical protein
MKYGEPVMHGVFRLESSTEICLVANYPRIGETS